MPSRSRRIRLPALLMSATGWAVGLAGAAGCAGKLAEVPKTPASEDPAAGRPPQYQVNLELGRKRELLKLDLRFLHDRIRSVGEEVAVLERDLRKAEGAPATPAPPPPATPQPAPQPIPPPPPMPPQVPPAATTEAAPVPASSNATPEVPAATPAPAAKDGKEMDPTERRLRKEIDALTSRRDAELARWRELLRRRGELRDELQRRAVPDPPKP